jgi:hypothetical protein
VPAGVAEAQQARAQDEGYVAIELLLGLGGEAGVETTVAGVTVDAEGDLELSFGGALSYMHPLHRYFVLGVQLGVLSWEAEVSSDRNLLIDLAIVPQGRVPLSDEVELTLSVPVGPVVDFWGGDELSVQAPGGGVSADIPPGFGFEIGFLLGVRYAVSTDVGVLARVGYVLQSFSHAVEVQAFGMTASQDFDISLGQPRLHVGVSF